MKKEIDKNILLQTRERLGAVDIMRGNAIKFKSSVLDTLEKQSLRWAKRYYTFDRNGAFALGDNFSDYSGQIAYQPLVSDETGGCYDGNVLYYQNAQYSIKILSKTARRVTLPLEVDDNINLSLYQYNSDDETTDNILIPTTSYYVNGNITLNFESDVWHTLYIYAYCNNSNGGYVNLLNGLISHIDNWDTVDLEAPSIPLWYSPPLTTSSDPLSRTTHNRLKWFIPSEGDWAGHGIYRREGVERTDTFKEKVTASDVILTARPTYDYGSGEKFSIGENTYTVKDRRLIKGNGIYNGNFSLGTAGWTTVESSSTGVESLYYSDYKSNGICLKMAVGSVSGTQLFGQICDNYIPVYTSKVYTFAYYSQRESAVAGKCAVMMYTSTDGTLCSTSSVNVYVSTSSTWQAHSFDIRVPSDAVYARTSLYAVYHTSHSAIQYFDNVKFAEYANDGMVFSDATTDAYGIVTVENLNVPPNNNTIYYAPLISTTESLLGGTVDYYANCSFVNHEIFNVMSGGAQLCNKHINKFSNSDFNTSNGWSTSNCSISIGSSTFYDPLFNGYCGKIYGYISTPNSYVYQQKTGLVDGSVCGISVYARKKYGDTVKLYLAASSNSLTEISTALTTTWQRFRLFHTIDGTTCSGRIGVSSTYAGNIFVDGALFEKMGYTSTASYVSIYDPLVLDGVSLSQGIMGATSISFSTTRGYVGFYIVPQEDSDDLDRGSKHIYFTAYKNPYFRDYTNATSLFYIAYEPRLSKFHVRSKNVATYNTSFYSSAITFESGERIYIGFNWSGSSGTLYINSTAYTGGFAQPIVDAYQINGQMSLFDYEIYNACFANITDLQIGTGQLTEETINKNAIADKPAPYPTNTAISFTKWEKLTERLRQDDTLNPIMWDDFDVVPNNTYIYQLDCFDRNGNRSGFSKEESIVAGDNISPDPITNTAYVTGYGAITYTWTNPSDTDFIGCKVYSNASLSTLITNVDGLPSENNLFVWTTSDGSVASKTIYVTTYDFNLNENTAYVSIYGETSEIAEAVNITYSSPNPLDRRSGTWWKQGSQTMSFRILVDTGLSACSASVYDGAGTKAYTDYTGTFVSTINGLGIWRFSSSYTTGKSNGNGYIKFNGQLTGGATFEKTLSISWDVDSPDINNSPYGLGVYINGVETYSGKSQTIMVDIPFDASPMDANSGVDWIWLDNKYSGTGYTPFADSRQGTKYKYSGDQNVTSIRVPLVIENRIATHSIWGRVYDVAQNYAQYTQSTAYTFLGTDIQLTVWSNLDSVDKSIRNGNWINAADIAGTDYCKCTASISAGDSIKKLGVHMYYVDTAGVTHELSTYTVDPWTGSEHSVTNFNTHMAYNANPFVVDFTVETLSGKSKNVQKIFYVDIADPSVSSLFDTAYCVVKNRGANIKIQRGNIYDNLSGYWKTEIYRKDSESASYPSQPIGVLVGNADTFVDYDERLEGYRTYNYRGMYFDNAGNTAFPAEHLTLTMTPDWEYTHRNKINNSSFEVAANGSLESWDTSHPAGTVAITGVYCAFGKKSLLLANSDYVVNSIFIPEISMRPPRYIISYYAQVNAALDIFQLEFFNYKDSSLGTKTLTDSYKESITGSDGNTWYRYSATCDPGAWSAGQKTCNKVELQILDNNGGRYFDAFQFEEATAHQTSPTAFRDNRVLTTDRFEADFIYGNMIKAAQIDGRHIVAAGIDVVDEEYGVPAITVGKYNVNNSFIRMEDNRLYYHPSAEGLTINEGYGFAKHIETGEAAFGSSAYFITHFTKWDGSQTIPQYMWTPTKLTVYRQVLALYDQEIFFTSNISSASINVNAQLMVGSYAEEWDTVTTLPMDVVGENATHTVSGTCDGNTIKITVEFNVTALYSGFGMFVYAAQVKAASGIWRDVKTDIFNNFYTTGVFNRTETITHASCVGCTKVYIEVTGIYPVGVTGEMTFVELGYYEGTVIAAVTGTEMGYYRYYVTDGSQNG